MFNLKNFIKEGLIKAVGYMADYQVILNSVGWFEKGVLEETDLEEIQLVIDQKNAPTNIEESTEDESFIPPEE